MSVCVSHTSFVDHQILREYSCTIFNSRTAHTADILPLSVIPSDRAGFAVLTVFSFCWLILFIRHRLSINFPSDFNFIYSGLILSCDDTIQLCQVVLENFFWTWWIQCYINKSCIKQRKPFLNICAVMS